MQKGGVKENMPADVEKQPRDFLEDWNPGALKDKIRAFVEAVTDKTSSEFVPPEDRIAAFDLDGTLLLEKEYPLVIRIALSELRRQARENTRLKTKEPWRAALENDRAWIMDLQNLWTVQARPFKNWTQTDYRKHVRRYITTRPDPRFQILPGQTFYAPVLGLMKYLRVKGFRVYIVSGSDREYIRALGKESLALPASHYLGAMIGVDIEFGDGGPRYVRNAFYQTLEGAEIGQTGDKRKDATRSEQRQSYQGACLAKALQIHYELGQSPILAFGNNDGDFEMLKSVSSLERPWLALLLDHDDPQREYEYPEPEKKAIWRNLAQKHNWEIVSMKNDFKTIFREPS